MTITVEPPRYAVEYRRPGERRWQTIVTVGSPEVAWQTATDLMTTRVGDWAVRQVPACMEPATPAPVPLKVEPRGTHR